MRMCGLAGIVVLAGMMATVRAERIETEVVDRDFRVTVVHSGSGALGRFSVVGNLAEGAVRVPVFKGDEVVMVMNIVAPVYGLNNTSYVRPQVSVIVFDQTRLVTDGGGGAAPAVILQCERKIDWADPDELVLLDGEQVKLT